MRYTLLIMYSALTLATACEDAPQDNDATAAEDEFRSAIDGDLLGEIEASPDHSVTFWEFAPGVVAIRESYGMDDGASSVLDTGALQGKTLGEIYRVLAKASVVPMEISMADARVQPMPASLSSDNDAPSRAASDEANDEDVVPYTADYYGDNYGAQWFLDRNCVEGGYRDCRTNITWAYSGRTTSNWFKTCAMAADFEAPVNFKGGHREYWSSWPWYGDWVTVMDWDYNVMARRVECWWYNGEGRRESWVTGLAPSPRAHYSALRM